VHAVRSVDPAALDALAGRLARAFADDPLYVWMFPDPERRRRALSWMMKSGLAYGRRYGRAVQTEDGVAAAVWQPPGRGVTTWGMIRSGFLAAPVHMGIRPFGRFMQLNALMERAHKQHAPDPHWYLMFVGVDPGSQGRGHGTALLLDGLALADAAGKPCYLETSNARNLPLYERHGFAIVETATIGDSGTTGWVMRRDQPMGSASPTGGGVRSGPAGD